MTKKPKTIMQSFRIDEISGVDKPAQKGARMVIMKRDGEAVEKAKDVTQQQLALGLYQAEVNPEARAKYLNPLELARVKSGHPGYKLPKKQPPGHTSGKKSPYNQTLWEYHWPLGTMMSDMGGSSSGGGRGTGAGSGSPPSANKSYSKRLWLTSSEDGHSHLIDDTQQGGTTSYERMGTDPDSYNGGHAHPWVQNEDGSITIGDALGHTHELIGQNVVVTEAYFEEQAKRYFEDGVVTEKGHWPIVDEIDVKCAVELLNKAQGEELRAEFAKHIFKRAQALECLDALEQDLFKRLLPDEGALTDMITKSNGDDSMTKTVDPNEPAERLRKAEDENKMLKNALALPAPQRALYDAMGDADKTAFLAKSDAERQAMVLAKAEADPVVFTAADGTAFRKSDDPRLVALAKRNDQLAKDASDAVEREATTRFEKRASEELSHCPGSTTAKVALLKAVNGITEATVKSEVLALLKSADKALKEVAFDKSEGASGAEGGQGGDDPEAKLNTLAKAHQKANPGMSFEKAYSHVMNTPEGVELYEQTQELAQG